MMFSILRRHSLVPLMLLLQVMLACAILCNVLFLAWQRIEPMLAQSGVDTDNLILVDNLTPRDGLFNAAQLAAADQALRGVPGVVAVSAAFGLPMVPTQLVDVNLQGPTGVTVGVNGYIGEGLVHTLDVQMVAGGDFAPSDYRDWGVGVAGGTAKMGIPMPIIITQSLATQLFGQRQAVGQLLHDPRYKVGSTYQVVGVVRHLLRNQISLATDGRADNTMLEAERISGGLMLAYAIRLSPTLHEQALRGVRTAIARSLGASMSADTVVNASFYQDRRAKAFKSQRAALWLFVAVTIAVLLVATLGIMGLTGFWVQQRTRQIGIYRALGARRVDILRQFLLENLFIVGVALLLGMILAYLGNSLLMAHYEIQRLPWLYLPLGSLVMLILGQLSVLGPARWAAAVPPVVATRAT